MCKIIKMPVSQQQLVNENITKSNAIEGKH